MSLDNLQVGFVGLGNIGQPMAATLARAGFDVRVYDVRPGPGDACVAAGATAAQSPRDAADGSDVVGVAVVSDSQVTEVVTGDDGVMAGIGSGVIAIHSTVLPPTVTAIARNAADQGAGVVDAPVSGGDMAARDGTLTVMAGGATEHLDRCRSYFDAIGKRVDFMGKAGAGAAAKLALQLMTYVNQLAALESVRLADAHGIDENKLIDLATATTADSWMMRHWGFFDRLMREHRLAGSDEVYHFFGKDLFDVVVAARETGVSLPVAGAAAQALAPAFKQRHEALDA